MLPKCVSKPIRKFRSKHPVLFIVISAGLLCTLAMPKAHAEVTWLVLGWAVATTYIVRAGWWKWALLESLTLGVYVGAHAHHPRMLWWSVAVLAAWCLWKLRHRRGVPRKFRDDLVMGRACWALLGHGSMPKDITARDRDLEYVRIATVNGDPAATGTVIYLTHAPGWRGTESQLNDLCTQARRSFSPAGEWEAQEPDSSGMTVKLHRMPPPFTWPTLLRYDELAPAGKRRDILRLGVMDGGDPFVWDISEEQSAHGLIAGFSGAGKTNLIRVLIAEFIRNGGLIDILDAKGGEDYRDDRANLAHHPAIRLHLEAREHVAVLDDFLAEFERRKVVPLRKRGQFPRRMLLIDETSEVNSAIEGDLGKAGHAEFIRKLLRAQRLVRSSRMHIVLATQKPLAEALASKALERKGGELRDQSGFRIGLGRLTPSASQMIFGNVDALPVAKGEQGRGQIADTGVYTYVHTAKLDFEPCVKLCAGVAGLASFGPAIHPGPDLLGAPGPSQGHGIPPVDSPVQPEPAAPVIVTDSDENAVIEFMEAQLASPEPDPANQPPVQPAVQPPNQPSSRTRTLEGAADQPTNQPTEQPAGGARGQREPVTLTCKGGGCAHHYQSRMKRGEVAKCPECGHRQKITKADRPE